MTLLDIAQLVFIVSVFGVGLIGFIYAVRKDDEK